MFVYPASDEDIEIEADPNDLRIDTCRASGRVNMLIKLIQQLELLIYLQTLFNSMSK